jgi:hypothetical protein
VTSIRDPGAVSHAAAKAFMALILVVAVPVTMYLVRECRRQKRWLTIEVMLFFSGGSLFWADHSLNFFQPVFEFSANLPNLNSPLGHMPLMVNPSIGEYADPIPFFLLAESFGFVGLLVAFRGMLRAAERRWPGLSLRKQFALIFLAAVAIDLVLEVGLAVPLGLWNYNSPAWMSLGLGRGLRFPLIEFLVAGAWIALSLAVALFKDDRGRTFFERGLERTPPRRRKWITFVAMFGALQAITWGPGTIPLVLYGPYQEPWPKLPKDLVGNVCDAPGVQGTPYGPCPGSPGYRMPGRTSRLTDEAP